MNNKQEQTVTALQEQLLQLEQTYKKQREELEKKLIRQREKTHEQGLLIPARSFATTLTPLETMVYALTNWYGLFSKEIAELLNRPVSSVEAALRNAREKDVVVYRFVNEEVLVNVQTLDTSLSPAKAVISQLLDTKLSPASIARLIGRDQRNIAKVRDELRGDTQ